MPNEFEPYPKEVDGVIISGELEETTGWLPYGPWTPPSMLELEVMERTEREARLRLEGLGFIFTPPPAA
jgi:hypothetical protein